MDTDYDNGFYDTITEGSTLSAQIMVPFYHGLIFDEPETVVDVGCGRGVWGKEFEKLGCEVLGVDGDYVADPVIPFMAHDLRNPLILDKKYDVAVCLEVAEHLPEDKAGVLVKSLVDASDRIMFSAAIPHQTGHGHINCQWPSYWVNLFAEHDYCVTDYRDEFWENPLVEPWYKQNVLVFWKSGEGLYDPLPPRMIDVVHPDIHYWGRS